MKILFSHFGLEGKGGWGRTFLMAAGLAKLGNEVMLMTVQPNSFKFPYIKKHISNVTVISFPEIIPNSLSNRGFGLLSLIIKLVFVCFNRADIVDADCGHRPGCGWPCLLHRLIYNSIYISEWWDYFGSGGQLENKPKIFKAFLGKYESYAEIADKKTANGVVVLSDSLRQRAIAHGVKTNHLIKIHGGANIKDIHYLPDSTVLKEKMGIPISNLVFGYIGMGDSEIDDLLPFIKAFTELVNVMDISWVCFGSKLSHLSKEKLKLQNEFYEFGYIDYSVDSSVLSCVDIYVLFKQDNIINCAGWPNKLGDYLACGRPILLNLYGEMIQFAEQFSKGLFIVDYDMKMIKEKIALIGQNRHILNGMGKINRNIAENCYSWDIQATKLFKFYCTIANGNL